MRLHLSAISPITDEASYEHAPNVLHELLTQVGEYEAHPLGALVESLTLRVTAYQDAANHIPPAAPNMELRLPVRGHALTQQALAEATGIDQGLLSKLLSGKRAKRAYTAKHARRLGGHFGVAPAAFL